MRRSWAPPLVPYVRRRSALQLGANSRWLATAGFAVTVPAARWQRPQQQRDSGERAAPAARAGIAKSCRLRSSFGENEPAGHTLAFDPTNGRCDHRAAFREWLHAQADEEEGSEAGGQDPLAEEDARDPDGDLRLDALEWLRLSRRRRGHRHVR